MTDEKTPAAPSLTLSQYENLQPRTGIKFGDAFMTFSTPSTLTQWRVRTIRTKEPCTLEWIAGFERDDVLIDCGANVGMYTIWAAATRGARVYAFEPEAQNYALLNRNILLNNLSERVTAFCMGLSDTSGLSVLHMTDMRAGGSCHSVGDALDFRLNKMSTVFDQGCVAFRLDELVANGSIPAPTHIKIDVDGFEHKVIAGARATLEDKGLKSLLIEINQNLPEHMAMVAELKALGFRWDDSQVAEAERKDGAFKGVAEYIFRR